MMSGARQIASSTAARGWAIERARKRKVQRERCKEKKLHPHNARTLSGGIILLELNIIYIYIAHSPLHTTHRQLDIAGH